MKKEGMSFFDWQARFDTEDACKEYLYSEKWPNGFQCPQCGHDHAHYLPSRGIIPMQWMPQTTFSHGGYRFSFNQVAVNEMVLGHLLGIIR